MVNPEYERLLKSGHDKNWKKWGPYVSERQWGTVREDYSPEGHAWTYINHDLARSYGYRWGEDGIAGFCDNEQVLDAPGLIFSLIHIPAIVPYFAELTVCCLFTT